MFIKAVFKTTFGLSDVLKSTFSALNHVNYIRQCNLRSDLLISWGTSVKV